MALAQQGQAETQPVQGLRGFDLLTPEQLKALSRLHSDDTPILSLYLDAPISEKKSAILRTQLDSLIDGRQRVLREQNRDLWHIFLDEAARLKEWLDTAYDERGRGLAIFSSIRLNLWRVFRLPAAVPDELILADRPYLRPLFAIMDDYERCLVLLVNKEKARTFVVDMGEITEYSEFADELVPKPKAGPGEALDKFERHHEMHVLWHIKHAVEQAEKLFQREKCNWLVIGGTDDPLVQLRQHLPKALVEKLAGEISVAVEASPAQVLDAVLAVQQANERRVEQQQVEALLTAALGKGPAVVGLDDTLEAIVEGRVMTLIVNDDFRQPGFECPNDGNLLAKPLQRCPLCNTLLDAQVDVVERALERALEQDAKIEIVHGGAYAKLAEHGHIGSLLRYSIGASPTEAGKPLATI